MSQSVNRASADLDIFLRICKIFYNGGMLKILPTLTAEYDYMTRHKNVLRTMPFRCVVLSHLR